LLKDGAGDHFLCLGRRSRIITRVATIAITVAN